MKNSMRNIILSASCAASMAGVAAVPAVTEHAFVQDPQTRVAALTFTLGAESVVTLDVQTNGVSIGVTSDNSLLLGTWEGIYKSTDWDSTWRTSGTNNE